MEVVPAKGGCGGSLDLGEDSRTTGGLGLGFGAVPVVTTRLRQNGG